MPIPDLTHLQFAVLAIVGPSERPGKYIREKLAAEGSGKSLPAFYQMMARLEDAKFVIASTRRAEVAGQPVTERWYKLSGLGIKALRETQAFYASRDLKGLGFAQEVRHV